MSSNEKQGWAEIFGEAQPNTEEQSISFDPQQIVKNAPEHLDTMRASFGKQIFQMIKDYQRMLQSKALLGSMKEQMQETYAFMVRAVRLDVRNLMNFQSEMIRVYWSLNDGVAKEALDALIIRLEHLIVRQAQMLRKINCATQIQTREYRTKEAYHDFYHLVEETINKGEYRNALGFLLLFNYIFDSKKAKSLLNLANSILGSHPNDANDFLPLLEKRIFLKSFLPNLENYSEFKNNSLLKAVRIEIEEGQNKGLDCFVVLLEDGVKIHSYLWEDKLKEHFKNSVLNEIDSLIGLQKSNS